MEGRTIFISGATDGIGKQAAKELARQGAHVILHGRNPHKMEQTLQWIREQVPEASLDRVLADMASQQQIRKMAEELHERYDKIDVLVNNAGVQIHERQDSEDGIELTFAINHIGYFLTTSLLLDLVAKSDYKRIVIVSSGMHYRVDRIDFDVLLGKNEYTLYTNYAHSKLANLLFGYKLARLVEPLGITVNCLHPGLVDTNLNPKRSPEVVARAIPVEKGIVSMMRLITDPELQGVTGKYFDSDGEERPSSDASYIVEDQERLWELSEELIGERFKIPN